MSNFYRAYGKRVFDIFFSLLVIFFSWPLFLIISLMIWLTDGLPIVFKQKRVGKDAKVFILYKFRTMINKAHKLQKKYLSLNEANGPVFKIKNDPRFINGLGKFLARSGLDELPNIINVLKDEMSWIGPRPLPINETLKINPKIRKIRESVLPGITSLWIISGAHQLKFKQWMNLDQQYIKNINLSTDLIILLKTAKVVSKIIVRKFIN